MKRYQEEQKKKREEEKRQAERKRLQSFLLPDIRSPKGTLNNHHSQSKIQLSVDPSSFVIFGNPQPEGRNNPFGQGNNDTTYDSKMMFSDTSMLEINNHQPITDS